MKFIKEVSEIWLTNSAFITYRKWNDEVKYLEIYINIFKFQLGFSFVSFND